MVVVQWRFHWRGLFGNIKRYISWKISQAVLTFYSLAYNIHMSQSYLVDCLLEPIYWFVDNFAGYLGKVFVFCVTCLTTAVVVIAYWLGLPYWWERSPQMTVVLLVFGNWLLLNVAFHYYMGVTTPPGYPSDGALVSEAASICKKCISPKPPRTHHCSVCDRCVLCMDHHCPWLNNCVGYYNARYFFLYMAYMVAGVIFIIVAGFDLGYQVLWVNDNGGITHEKDPDLIGHPVRLNRSGAFVPVQVIAEYYADNSPRVYDLPIPVTIEAQNITANPIKRRAVVFMTVMCFSVFFALGTLTILHAKNISKGETSIESHINATLRKTHTRHLFRNPYNFGRMKNWKLFLGLTQGGITHENYPDLIGHPVRLNRSGAFVPVQVIAEYDADNSPRVHDLPIPVITEAQKITANAIKRRAVVFMTVICFSVFFALGTLTILHAKNISKGETSIESHINATLRKTHTKHLFRNPYNFGRTKNWKLFLGLTQGRTFLRHVLLPSPHPPNGTGLSWHTVNSTIEDWP